MRRATDGTWKYKRVALFQSTLSMRRATLGFLIVHRLNAISIHALHEESDLRKLLSRCLRFAISIHALHEESDNSYRWA